MVTDEVAWQDDEPEPPPRPAPDGLAQRQIVIVLAVLAIIAVIVILILLVKAVSGSDNTPPRRRRRRRRPLRRHDAGEHDPDGYDADEHDADEHDAHGGGVTSVPTEATLRAGMSGSSDRPAEGAEPARLRRGHGGRQLRSRDDRRRDAFQKDKGLTQDGTAGPATLAAINTALAAG
jgi:hypothetical protein